MDSEIKNIQNRANKTKSNNLMLVSINNECSIETIRHVI